MNRLLPSPLIGLSRGAAALAAAGALLLPTQAGALDLGTQPLYLGGSVPPIVMLLTPKDHQLFKKAYDDFSDLDGTLPGGDTALETSYKHSIDYYGYFDPFKCYLYSNANGRFEPSTITADKYCAASTAWSGNFLNWVSMSRIDIMRRLLYGGKRSTDTATTVLERELIPTEAHAWAKHYRGTDLYQLTPFTASQVLTTARIYTSATSLTFAGTGTRVYSVTNTSSDAHPMILGDQVSVCRAAPNSSQCMFGQITTTSSTSVTVTIHGQAAGNPAGSFTDWRITNHSSAGISFCNTTQATSGTSHGSTAAPLVRAAAGDYTLWGVGDGTACRWSDETGGVNGNRRIDTEMDANANAPLRNTAGLPTTHLNNGGVANGDYNARILACDTSLIGAEACTQYPNGNFKPTGLLQDYASGSQKKIKFGLFTGSYAKNKTGGILRKNPGFLDSTTSALPSNFDAAADEINGDSGAFNTAVTGIIRSFDVLKLYGYTFAGGTGSYTASDGCGLLSPDPAEGICTSWGNPLSEVYVETLRYLAGKSGPYSVSIAVTTTTATAAAGATAVTVASTTLVVNGNAITITLDNGSLHSATVNGTPTATSIPFTPAIPAGRSVLNAAAIARVDSFSYTQAGSKDATVGLLQPAWVNQLTSTNFCTPLNVIVMNASVSSYDNDLVPSDLFPAGSTAVTLTNTIGGTGYEGLSGSVLIGNNGTTNNGICSPKTIGASPNGLGNIFGICPEAPALRGSYQMAGAAWWARTNRIRSDITGVPPSDTRSLKVTTYGVALASAVPTIQIPVPGTSPVTYVTIQPTARTFNGAIDRGHGSIVDFKVIRQNLAAGTGKFFVSWEDSTQGNDYDLDMWGTISYSFPSAGQIQVTTDVIYGAAGHSIAFGYVISGTTDGEGAHFTSAHKGGGGTVISYHYPTGFNTSLTGNNECNDCSTANAAASKSYTVAAGGAASVLKEPLWYASKYGGFVDQDGNNRPNLVQEWDSKNNITGADGADANPDTFFPVTNPGALQQALDRAFISVLQVSSASSVATNSTSLQSGSTVFQARFNANEWSGQLLAFSISTLGLIDPAPLWDASQLVPAASARSIVTFKRDPGNQAQGDPGGKGVPFRWANMSTLQQADLGKNAAGTADVAGTLCTGVTVTGFTPAGCTLQGSLRLNWLRGDPANEGATASKYRLRPSTKLGDIVNSTPTFVGPPSTLQYGEFSPPAAVYSATSEPTFAAWASDPARANRRAMIYAGANDGMMHGFDASTGSGRGVEKLAYVPATSYRHLTKLTDKTYSHRYFVDGSPTVADVRYQDGSWHTILVGGLNAGGQGVFALDITDPGPSADPANPGQFTEANANSLVLWEFSDHNDSWLGNTYSQPTVAKMNNGRFAVIFASGYNTSIGETGDTLLGSGCATLYILYVDGGIDGVWTSGTDFRFIDVLTGCSTSNPNGLATPRALDVDSNGTADYIYAGDLNGRMWKFDVRDANPSNWVIANGGSRLFRARDANGNPQPITAAATTIHPNTDTAALGVGSMVLFGTGKYLEQVDDSPVFTNDSFYGIWDKHDGSTVSSTPNRNALLEQKVLGATVSNPTGATLDNPATTTVDESGFRITTPYRPNYGGGTRTNTQFGESNSSAVDATATSPAHRGWYLDFPFSGDSGALTPGTGERVVFRPILSTGKLVFTTLIPSTLSCQFGGTSFLMDLNPITGGRLAISPFDVNNDSNFSDADKILDPYGNPVYVSGKASSIGIVPTPTVIQMTPGVGGTPGKEVKVLSGSSGQLISVLESGEPGTLPGATGRRVLWRQLFTD